MRKFLLVDVVIAPPALYVPALQSALTNTSIQLATQDISDQQSGAYTGQLSVSMLQDLGLSWAIIGHSERRQHNREDDEDIGRKLAAIISNSKIGAVLCVGESMEDRKAGLTDDRVTRQLKKTFERLKSMGVQLDASRLVVAYEPIWAIGTGQVATKEQAQAVHATLRAFLAKEVGEEAAQSIRIIYGGSVTGSNCQELAQCPDIDGFLVGGASLKPEFKDIVNSCDQ